MIYRKFHSTSIPIHYWEKYLNVLWFIITVWFAYATLQEVISNKHIHLLAWFFLHCIVAILFLIRKDAIKYSSSPIAYIVAIASVNYYLLYDLTIYENPVFFPIGVGVTVVGEVMCVASTLSLGRCFAILPAYRGIKTTAAYRFVRHPIYLSYIVLDIGILISYLSVDNLIIFVVSILLFILRIGYEEKVLQYSETYLEYKQKVKYKLIPLVY